MAPGFENSLAWMASDDCEENNTVLWCQRTVTVTVTVLDFICLFYANVQIPNTNKIYVTKTTPYWDARGLSLFWMSSVYIMSMSKHQIQINKWNQNWRKCFAVMGKQLEFESTNATPSFIYFLLSWYILHFPASFLFVSFLVRTNTVTKWLMLK